MSAAVLVLWVEQVKHQGKGGETCSLVSIAIGRGVHQGVDVGLFFGRCSLI